MWAVITLRSLIWARTYMRMYTNSVGQTSVCAVWTEHVQIICGKFVYTNRSLRHAQIACLITTWLYRNIVKTSAQSGQKMGFRKITPHSRVCKSTFCSSHAFWSTYSYISSVQRYFCSIASREKNTVCHVRTTITKSDCTPNQPRIYFSLYSYPCVYAYTKLALEIRRLNWVYLADRKVFWALLEIASI